MTAFADIWGRAVARKGEQALLDRMPHPKPDAELLATPDHRYLAEMTKRIFQAGFVWKVVEHKWPGFEHAFQGFDVDWLARATDADFEALKADTNIIRNGQKIRAVFDNARYVRSVAEAHGSFGQFVADWPCSNIVELWESFAKGGSRLGGNTGPLFLRMVGKDTFMLSPDVTKALIEGGVIEKKPTSKKARRAVQAAFNNWHDESGRPLSQISMALACSVD